MKKSLFTIVTLLCLFTLLANNDLDKQMKRYVSVINESENQAKISESATSLSGMVAENPDRWEPLYYSALGYVKLFGFEETKAGKDAQLDKADVSIKLLIKRLPDHSEVITLNAYSLIMRLTVDPGSRGMDYSGEIFDNLLKAIRVNPNNPRAQFLMARMKIGTAQFMGTGYGDACKNLKKAHEIFENGEEYESDFSPSWGKEETASTVKSYCAG